MAILPEYFLDIPLFDIGSWGENGSVAWTLFCIFISYSMLELAITNMMARKGRQHPLVGGIKKPFLVPRFILNLMFAGKAANLIDQGYQKVSKYHHPPWI